MNLLQPGGRKLPFNLLTFHLTAFICVLPSCHACSGILRAYWRYEGCSISHRSSGKRELSRESWISPVLVPTLLEFLLMEDACFLGDPAGKHCIHGYVLPDPDKCSSCGFIACLLKRALTIITWLPSIPRAGIPWKRG